MTKPTDKDLQPISATDAKVNFGDVLHRTSVEGEKLLVFRQGKPISVVISYAEYNRIMAKLGK